MQRHLEMGVFRGWLEAELDDTRYGVSIEKSCCPREQPGNFTFRDLLQGCSGTGVVQESVTSQRPNGENT